MRLGASRGPVLRILLVTQKTLVQLSPEGCTCHEHLSLLAATTEACSPRALFHNKRNHHHEEPRDSATRE